MRSLRQLAENMGLIKAKMPEGSPHIAVYSLIILDSLVKKTASLQEVKQAIRAYPEDTHNEGHICKNMMQFVDACPTFELLDESIEKQFIENGGRSSTESQRDSMEKLESWYGN